MKQRNLKGMMMKELIQKMKKCFHVRYALVDSTGYVLCIYHDKIGATTVAKDMEGTNLEGGPFKVKRVVSLSWF